MDLFFGITTVELAALARQVGFALAGAAALWGFVFSLRDFHCGRERECFIYDWLSMRLLALFTFGVILGFVGQAFIFASSPDFGLGFVQAMLAHAHVGISIAPTPLEIAASTFILYPLLGALVIGTGALLLLARLASGRLSNLQTPLYGAMFLVLFALTSISGWRGAVDGPQAFYFIHGFHSIFTLGSVLVLDFLFLISSRSVLLKQHIYELFPTISKVIWAGFALDLASIFLVVDGFVVTEKFFFVQTVVGILLVNGVLLSGPLARKMMNEVARGGKLMREPFRRLAHIAGALSITSWLTITILDFFAHLTLSYLQLVLAYIMLFATALVAHVLFDLWERRTRPYAREIENI